MTLEEKLESNLYDLEDFKKSLKIDGFDDSVIGTTDNNALVYDYEKMVAEYVQRNGCSETEAMEYIDFNIVNAGIGGKEYIQPVIVYAFE